jgi:hypothetical protein
MLVIAFAQSLLPHIHTVVINEIKETFPKIKKWPNRGTGMKWRD